MSFPPFFQAERLFIVFGKCVKYRFVVLYVVLTIVSKSVSLFVTKLLTPTFELIFEFVVFIDHSFKFTFCYVYTPELLQ